MRGLEFLWDAFWELTTERSSGFNGEGRIPGSKIRQFADENGYQGETFRWFKSVIREMDAEYLGLRVVEPPNDLLNETPMSDVQGVRAMLRRHAKDPNHITTDD